MSLLNDFLNEIEQDQKLDEYDIARGIEKLSIEEDSVDHQNSQYEIIAFKLRENKGDEQTEWEIHFRPFISFTSEAGELLHSPDLKSITSETIDYWQHRARESQHPVMQARYADLAWTFSNLIPPRADFQNVGLAVDALIETATDRRLNHDVYLVDKLKRALSIALSVNNKTMIQKVIDAMISFEVSLGDKGAERGMCFDSLLNQRNIDLSDELQGDIIKRMESYFGRVANPEADSFNPWDSERSALRLANYYRKHGEIDEVKRVLHAHNLAIEHLCLDASALQVGAWLKTLHTIFSDHGLNSEAADLLIKIREAGLRSRDEMGTIESSFKITPDERKNFLKSLLRESLHDSLHVIAYQFLPKHDEVVNQVKDLASTSSLMMAIPRALTDHTGRTVAMLGPPNEDFEGNVIYTMLRNMQIGSCFINWAIEQAFETFELSEEQLIEHFYKSPVFQDSQREILRAGAKAYLEKSYIAAIHVWIPQIEEAIRYTIQSCGGAVLSPDKPGLYKLKTLSALLQDPMLEAVYERDFVIYLKALLNDQRGWNVRNAICHGICQPDSINESMADRIFHVLLVLSTIRTE